MNSKVANYADDNTLYICRLNEADTINELQSDSTILIKWFDTTLLKMDPNKSHVIITSDERNSKVQMEESFVMPSSEVTLLGIIIDNKLTFKAHVETLRKKSFAAQLGLRNICQ